MATVREILIKNGYSKGSNDPIAIHDTCDMYVSHRYLSNSVWDDVLVKRVKDSYYQDGILHIVTEDANLYNGDSVWAV